MKTCTKCHIEKEESEYSIIKSKNKLRPYCKQCGRDMSNAYKANHKDKISSYNKSYKSEHKEETRIYNNQYGKTRKGEDFNFKILTTMRSRISKCLKLIKEEKEITSKQLLDLDPDLVKQWMIYCFTSDEFDFTNYGTVWHIDHVLPCRHFDLSNEHHLKMCFGWWNIRPLEAKENLSKNDKIIWEDINNHRINLEKFALENNLDISLYVSYIDNLEYTKSN